MDGPDSKKAARVRLSSLDSPATIPDWKGRPKMLRGTLAKKHMAKIDAATTNRGDGKAGIADRTGQDKGGHAKYECPHCKITAPDVKTMQIHHDSKHPKIAFDEAAIVNRHASTSQAAPAEKPKPGVRGSLKK